MTLEFPPKCAEWCTTYKHLKRLFYTPLELCRVCHKCITWNQQLLHRKTTPALQHTLPIDQ